MEQTPDRHGNVSIESEDMVSVDIENIKGFSDFVSTAKRDGAEFVSFEFHAAQTDESEPFYKFVMKYEGTQFDGIGQRKTFFSSSRILDKKIVHGGAAGGGGSASKDESELELLFESSVKTEILHPFVDKMKNPSATLTMTTAMDVPFVFEYENRGGAKVSIMLQCWTDE